MADLSITAANVSLTSGNATVEQVVYGATITQGQVLYEDANDSNKYKLADNDDVTQAAAKGIALTPGASGEKGYVVKKGPIDVGATLTVGSRYYVGESGGIAPEADIGTGEFVTLLGIATAAGVLELNINASGIAVP